MELIDLTHTIKNNMTAYCKEEIPNIQKLSSINSHGYSVNKLEITTHTSTHIDAPSHMIKNGNDIDDIPLEFFYGKGIVINCSKLSSKKIPIDILNTYNLNNKDFILFYTGHDKLWNSDKFLYGYKYPSLELCRYISTLNIKGVGIDTISIDSDNSNNFENHHLFFNNNILIIENLCNLNLILNLNFSLCLFPLKIKNGDASPIRAVAKII